MDTAELKRRREASRRFTAEEDGLSFTLLRPTTTQSIGLRDLAREVGESARQVGEGDSARLLLGEAEFERLSEAVVDYAVDWSGVTEGHLVEGGGAEAVAYDTDLLRDLLADRPALADRLLGRLIDAADRYLQRLQDEKKASANG
ncbi:MAG: hypothetical protein ACOCUM_00315 [Thiohalospira sp.]